MKVAVISGPYRADTINQTVENIRFAEKYAKKYWELGYSVICPHKNTALFDGVLPDYVWLEGAKELIKRADVLVCIPGWQDSIGSMGEHDFASWIGKKIIYDEEIL